LASLERHARCVAEIHPNHRRTGRRTPDIRRQFAGAASRIENHAIAQRTKIFEAERFSEVFQALCPAFAINQIALETSLAVQLPLFAKRPLRPRGRNLAAQHPRHSVKDRKPCGTPGAE
jgi:hypothetical protein